ncbi:hypothetical protein [Streptomyces sp. UNOB3_S3]|uniref:hypothetical protein n=1 Tax=Streptomyces sp. UNOB3_S3 TaxID=2871682 RepID=UPI001E5E081B|nr:hypothetical protein [Streptomyces sp. UNOB3_S3]
MTRWTLRALGLDVVPALRPLAYPGRPATEPALLTGPELLPLTPGPAPLGDWRPAGPDALEAPDAPDTSGGPSLDRALAALGRDPADRRHPVLAVGSNASPAQLAHKFAGAGLSAAVPLVPVRVGGVAVGCSGHIGRHGYVAAAPYAAPGARTTLVAGWLDGEQLAAVDATEFNYRRVLLPGDRFPVTLPSGERLRGAYLYVSKWGVLTGPPGGGAPRPGGGDQSALLAALLAGSARLRALLGPGPRDWVERAAADPELRKEGTRILAQEGWVERTVGLPAYEPPGPGALTYGDLRGPL